MALRSVGMCLCRNASLFKSKSMLVTGSARIVTLGCHKTYSLSTFPVSHRKFSQCSVLNRSATSRNESVKGLADEVLKAKLEADRASTKESHSSEDKHEKQKSDDFSKRAMKYTFIAFGTLFSGIAGFLVVEWGAPPRDERGNLIHDEFSEMPSWKAYLLRTYREVMFYNKMIKDPSREKLLPDPLTEPYFQPPYTLVLEMTGILVHPDWTYQTGWRFKKRPGVDFFLQQVGPPLFEVVVYTSEQGFTAFPILDTLDPQGYITYRLFRDATRYMNGHHVKDLSCINRDLKKVILVDWNDKSFSLQPENAFRLKKWSGNDDDRTLLDLAIFLRTIGTSSVEDVRTVLEYYAQFDDPLGAFKENQRRLEVEQQKQATEQETKEKGALAKSWTGGFWGRR